MIVRAISLVLGCAKQAREPASCSGEIHAGENMAAVGDSFPGGKILRKEKPSVVETAVKARSGRACGMRVCFSKRLCSMPRSCVDSGLSTTPKRRGRSVFFPLTSLPVQADSFASPFLVTPQSVRDIEKDWYYSRFDAVLDENATQVHCR